MVRKVGIFLLFVLMGCQSQHLDLESGITEIEVYKWDEEAIVTTIEDQTVITEVVKELNRAGTSSTASMDLPLPDYKLHFKKNDQVVFEVGYYQEVKEFGREGRYWKGDTLYSASRPLPIHPE